MLLSTFEEIDPQIVPTESFMFGVEGAGWGQGKWSDGRPYTALRAALDAMKAKPSNTQDALIAEVALKNGMALITADRNLMEVAERFGVNVKFFAPDLAASSDADAIL
jgi:hypothetical protein